MEKNYNHKAFEDAIYQQWEKSGRLFANANTKKPTFSIVLPPPNVTGVLHMGHACMLAIEDILVRYKKMTGHEVLWVPGTDHAAIATENVVLKHLGVQKRDTLEREAFLEACRSFSQEKHDTIINQTKKMGSWLDWSREAYTLDEEREFAVQKMFQMLWKDGLIVRGYRMVNWSIGAQSVLADDEVEYKEKEGFLYTFAYELSDGSETLHVATTRPETLFGDVAIAIHPDDKRAARLKGKTVKTPFSLREIPIICDEYVDMNFGTATLKVTPAHDPNDFEIGERHDLPQIQVIDFQGNMMASEYVPEEFQGLSREDCRKKITQDSQFLIEKKPYTHSVGHCYRSGTVIEPMLSKQWFIAVNNEFFVEGVGKTTLKKLTLDAVKDSHIQVIPKRFEKTYYQWIENLRDWCISRQIWWGHRIPVWYDNNGNTYMPHEQKFILARHGETNANVEHLVQGQNDELSDVGIAQAHELSAELKNKYTVTHIITSSSRRAVQTAEIVAQSLGVEIEICDDLRAIDFGSITGKYYASGTAIEHALAEGTGEDPSVVYERVEKAWNSLKTRHSKGDILIIGHRSIFSALENIRKGKKDTQNLIRARTKNEKTLHGVWKSISVFQPPITEVPIFQDEDTLDTWFSSALWPFSTLGWPDTSHPDFQTFYPNQLMETGHDILFFWVARMIMFGKYATGRYPFSHIYLHGMVTDEKGQKMSKSKGNGIDPLDLIDRYGADTVRLSLVIGTSAGNNMALGQSKIEGYRNFVNKIWNAGRFVQMQTQLGTDISFKNLRETPPEPKNLADQWILHQLALVAQDVQTALDEYQISRAGDIMYHFVWDQFCDWYIEASKQDSNPLFLRWVFSEVLILIHPLCPFVTQSVFQSLWGEDMMLMDFDYASFDIQHTQSSELFVYIQDVVTRIRKQKSDAKVNPKAKLNVYFQTNDISKAQLVKPFIESLALVSIQDIQSQFHLSQNVQPIVCVNDIFYLDIPKDTALLQKECDVLLQKIKALQTRLANPSYTEKAPPHLVEATQNELEEAQVLLQQKQEELEA